MVKMFKYSYDSELFLEVYRGWWFVFAADVHYIKFF
jgi:hypothetical protein